MIDSKLNKDLINFPLETVSADRSAVLSFWELLSQR